MKDLYKQKQILLLINQLFVVIFLCYLHVQAQTVRTPELVPLTLFTILVMEGAYIGLVNIKENNVLAKFTNLLLLTSWQFLLTLYEHSIFYSLSTVLSVVILYQIVQFLLLFFFQDSSYTYKKEKDLLLRALCLLTLAAAFINDKLYAILFLCQLILSICCIIILFSKHRKRILFVLKSERKYLLTSFSMIILPSLGYVIWFAESPEHLSNIGWYIMIVLPLLSIHAIAFKHKKVLKQYFPLKWSDLGLLLLFLLVCILLFGILFKFKLLSYFIIIHTIFLFLLLYFTLLYRNSKENFLNSNTEQQTIRQDSFFTHNLTQIAKTEELKRDISNYLHDEILQDILSIKNMMNKSSKTEIHELIVKTLDHLNSSIREQMNEYHPTLLKTLTLKENYSHLLRMIQKKYEIKKIDISFNCHENLFLVQPYHLVIYRILKELVTNSLKHSKCSLLTVVLRLENEMIELIVEDNGVGMENPDTQVSNNRGLYSIKEQVFLLNGEITFSECSPGLKISILIPMRGDDSYQYFINR